MAGELANAAKTPAYKRHITEQTIATAAGLMKDWTTALIQLQTLAHFRVCDVRPSAPTTKRAAISSTCLLVQLRRSGLPLASHCLRRLRAALPPRHLRRLGVTLLAWSGGRTKTRGCVVASYLASCDARSALRRCKHPTMAVHVRRWRRGGHKSLRLWFRRLPTGASVRRAHDP
jgi:hypothetical protein